MIEFCLFIALEIQIGILFYLVTKKQTVVSFDDRPKKQDTILRSMTKAISYKDVSGKKKPKYYDEHEQWIKEQEK